MGKNLGTVVMSLRVLVKKSINVVEEYLSLHAHRHYSLYSVHIANAHIPGIVGGSVVLCASNLFFLF